MTTAHSSIMDVEYRLLSLAHLPLSPSRHSYSIGAGACCCVCGGRYACRRLPSPSVNISSASEQVAGDVSTASSSVFSFFVYGLSNDASACLALAFADLAGAG